MPNETLVFRQLSVRSSEVFPVCSLNVTPSAATIKEAGTPSITARVHVRVPLASHASLNFKGRVSSWRWL